MQRAIRARDAAFSGAVNPNLLVADGKSDARQYAGRAVEDDWLCPLIVR